MKTFLGYWGHVYVFRRERERERENIYIRDNFVNKIYYHGQFCHWIKYYIPYLYVV